MGELPSTYDSEKEIESRRIKVNRIEDSYNSYAITEKEKRDWSGNIYLWGLAVILAIAYLC